MDKLFIVDAVNYLFRAYYAIGPMTNGKGQSTSALYGFIRSIQKLVKDFSPEYLVCVFDGPDNKKSRQTVYADYKMHRKGAPEDLFPQFEWAAEYCELAGIPMLCIEGVEADDTMASIVKWAEKEGGQNFLCSSDKDLMQLINSQTYMLHVHKDDLIVDAKKVEELFGVRPDQMLDLLAMMGDASDNIPGLEGFGPKTAASLLQQFGTLDEILKHPEKVKGEKKQQILRTQSDVALLSRELATLNIKVPIPEETSFYQLKKPQLQLLENLYHSMNFTSLLKEMGVEQGQEEKGSSTKKNIVMKGYHLVDEEEALYALLQKLGEQPQVALDVETTVEHPMTAKLVGIGFGYEPGEAWYIPCNGKLGAKKVQEALSSFFGYAKGAFYGHNLKFDLHILENIGIEVRNICFDTLVASYLLNPQNRRHNLDELTLQILKKTKIPIETILGKGKETHGMWDAPLEQVKEYCCEDVDCTVRLKEYLEEALEKGKLDSLLYDLELPLLKILTSMERTGIYLVPEGLEEVGHKLHRELAILKKEIFSMAGEEINLNSPKQLGELLFQRLGLPPPRKKGGEFSTSAEVLEQLAPEYPIASKLLVYRGLEKLRSTYTEKLPKEINPSTGRIHCTFSQSTAATGRLSCQDPNLQNIPVRTDEGLAIRSCFKPQKNGWYFVGADYSQIELRLLAHFSEDPELVAAFRQGEDIHVHTAALVFGVARTEVTPVMRGQAKTVNFGILYGQGPYSLSRQLGISMQEATLFIKKYFEKYPRVAAYLEEMKEMARKTGVAITLTGRRRPIPEIHNKNPSIRAGAERLAINTPLQGTAADLIKKAMIEIDRVIEERNLEGKMILQIHDELIFEVPESEISVFQALVKEKMEQAMELLVPIEVHVAVGKNWAEC